MHLEEVTVSFDCQRLMKKAENDRIYNMEMSFTADYDCGCYRLFVVTPKTVENQYHRHPQCNGACAMTCPTEKPRV